MKSKQINTDSTALIYPLTVLLTINAMLFLVPKLVLIRFVNMSLWGDVTSQNLVGAIAQDLFVALVVSIIVVALLRKPSKLRLISAFLVGGIVLLLLCIDMRVREIWLEPLGLPIIRYGLENLSGLSSGIDLFFNHNALYSYPITFRKFLFFIAVIYTVNWILISRITMSGITIRSRQSRLVVLVVTALAVVLIAFALSAPRFRYRMNENILIGGLVSIFRGSSSESNAQTEKRAGNFEEKLSQLPSRLKFERNILKNIKPFRNVVVVVYESMRWRDLNLLDKGTSLAPVLAQMAANGIVSKSYISVPHSSKAYYAILSGRIPYPGIEMRELFQEKNATLWRYFKTTRHMNTYAFSSLFLGFEGMGKELKSLGIDSFEASELAKEKGIKIASASSFGTNDEDLYNLGSEFIRKKGIPFSAVFFPIAAHYPYDCKGSVPDRHNIADYEKCVAESDTNLAKLLEEFRRLDLMRDTLFVVVGDHGESFGEHGLYVHNSSMYDEEDTIPLIFWSEDGRLGHHLIPFSRQIDIVPTIADLMGAMEANISVQGISLLRQQNPPPPAFMSTFFDGLGLALYEPPYKYILDPSTNKLTVFNDLNDPLEKSPVSIAEEKKGEIIERILSFSAYQKSVFSAR
jgi:glucan phosphoethanolaminetransferase (alkaline phosphatase superfamily)